MLLKVLLTLCSSALVSAGVIGTDYSPATSVSYSSISSPTLVKTVTTPIGYTKTLHASPVYESVLTTKESKFQSPDGSQHSTFTKSYDTAYSSLNKFESKGNNGDLYANAIPSLYSTPVHSQVYHSDGGYSYPVPTHTFSTPSKLVSYTKTVSSPTITSYTTPVLSKTKYVTSGLSSYSSPFVHTVSTPVFSKTTYTHSGPLTYATPIVSKTKLVSSGLSAYATPLVHTVSAPAYTKSVSVPITYTSHAVPLTKTVLSSPTISYTSPVLSKTKVLTSGLSGYSHTPVLESHPIKTTLTYSDAPVVSHMSFSGLGASYAW